MFWQDHEGEDGRKAWDIVKGGELEWRVREDERGLGGNLEGSEWGGGGMVRLKLAPFHSSRQTKADYRFVFGVSRRL